MTGSKTNRPPAVEIDDEDLDAVAGGAYASTVRTATISMTETSSSLGDVDLDTQFITYIDPGHAADGVKLKR